MASEIINPSLSGGFPGVGPVLDQYTPIIGGDAFDRNHGLPRWLPARHRRRVKAYEKLDAAYSLVDEPIDEQADMEPVRLGIVPYAIQVLRDLTVGGEQIIRVKGAANEDAANALTTEQESLNEWALRNRFMSKVQKAEELTSLLGDVFFRLRIGRTRQVKDCKVDILHPSFVFPEFDKDGAMEIVSLMWEEYKYDANSGMDVLRVYQDTYEYAPSGDVLETAGWYTFTESPGLNDLIILEYDKTADGKDINQLNLGVKNIPVFHLPNFWTHFDFGESDLAYTLQGAEEINACDTDLSAAARLAGIPPLALSGLKGRVPKGDGKATAEETIGPGKIFNLDANGRAAYVDNTTMLKALTEYSDRMEDKFFRNIRLGKLFAGKTDNIRDVESSKAFKTLMATLYARVAQKRTVRKAFYCELLGGVRDILIQIAGPAGYPEKELTLELGNILPLDNSDDLAVVTAAWAQGKGFLSTATAVRMGAKAGTGVVDFKREAAEVTDQLEILSGKGAVPADVEPTNAPKQPAGPAPAKKFKLAAK